MTDPITRIEQVDGPRRPFFPFTLRAIDNGRHVVQPEGFRNLWLKVKPNNLTWYAFDVQINSPTSVTFTVYGMKDMVYGGIGDMKLSLTAQTDAATTMLAIQQRAAALAQIQRQEELDAQEAKIIDGYAAEILRDALASAEGRHDSDMDLALLAAILRTERNEP